MGSTPKVHVAVLTALAMSLPGLPPAMAGGPPAGALEGKILEAAGGPVQGAVVLMRNLEDASEHASEPSGADGAYALSKLPAGTYEIAVRTGEGLYLGARTIRVSELGSQSYSFRIEDRPRSEILSYAEKEDPDEEGEPEEEEEKRKKAGIIPPLGWDNPLVVLASGIVFVIGAGALIDAVDGEPDAEDTDGSPSGP